MSIMHHYSNLEFDLISRYELALFYFVIDCPYIFKSHINYVSRHHYSLVIRCYKLKQVMHLTKYFFLVITILQFVSGKPISEEESKTLEMEQNSTGTNLAMGIFALIVSSPGIQFVCLAFFIWFFCNFVCCCLNCLEICCC